MIASSNHKENAMDVSIADKLCKLRKQNGLTQEDLADQLGVSRQAVSKWERAEASPDTDNLIMLANLYGVSLDELLEINVTQRLAIKPLISDLSITSFLLPRCS